MSHNSLALGSFQTFGDLLKYLRRRERLTQLELSIAVGYSESQISRLEQNQRLPDLAALKAVFFPALHLEDEPDLSILLLHLAQSARQEDAPIAGIPPYKGLLFFDQSDADLFFGRETLTAHLVTRTTDLAAVASSRFLTIVGASGSGKSSLMRAGLAVTLQRSGWEVHIFTPTANPVKMLTASYNSAHTKDGKQHLILVDQFEETFTLCRDENERVEFIEKLLSIAQDGSVKATVVIALRADFYSHCAQYPLLREAVAAEQEYIGQMSKEELRRAIEEPAKRGGWEFERGLVDVLLNDVGADGAGQPEPGALPLLSHALLATWERRRGRTFTIDGYRASGGVRGAIAETAESVFNDHFNRRQKNLARTIFLRLTELGEGTEDTRRRATLNELVSQSEEAAQLRAVLNMLADARLVTLNEDSAEVAHEALIREWQRLHEWLSQDREGLRLHRHLTDSAHEWEARGQDAAELYRGARLVQVHEWASSNDDKLNAAESRFIAASIELEEREELDRETQRSRELIAARELAETQSRAAKQLRQRAVFMTGAFVLAIALAGIAVFFGNQANQNAAEAQRNAESAQQNAESASASQQQAESERRTAVSRELAAAAISSLESDPERSILLALQAEATEHTIEAENALHRSILASHVLLTIHNDHEVNGISYSPDGRYIATSSKDNTAKIWDANTGRLLLTLAGHYDEVYFIDYSPDGKFIATSSFDHTAKIWDANTGQVLRTLEGHTDRVNDMSFNPDGTKVATSSHDTTVKIWDVATGRELLTISGNNDWVWSVAFSPDGTRIASASQDGIVKVWDADSGEELLTLPVEGSPMLYSIAFNLDGTRIAAGGGSQYPFMKIWDAVTGDILLDNTFGHTSAINNIAFAPGGNLASTVGDDQKTKVWDSMTGQVLYELSGHTGPVVHATFSPDGTRLATASWDGTVRIWDITPQKEALFIPFANTDTSNWTWWLTYSPDGKRIITDYTDGDARIWDAESGRELLRLTGPALYTTFSPDGKLAAGGNYENNIIVWDAQTGSQLTTLVGHEDIVLQVFFSPDGTRLASASTDGDLTVWDLANSRALFSVHEFGDAVTSVAYSPDGKYIVAGGGTGGSGYGLILDATTGEKLFTLPLDGFLGAVSYSPDGKRVALSDFTGAVSIWDALTGEQVLTLRGHTTWVYAIPFSRDGKWIATASSDGTARVWDAVTGANVLTLNVDSQGVGGVEFSPDGKHLAVGGKLGISIFYLRIDDVIALAKTRVTRQLTIEECQQYLHMEACPIIQK